MLVQKY